eukprot:COSAG02_NODE_40045_length_409_cov_2.190323_1_plen_50_part_10
MVEGSLRCATPEPPESFQLLASDETIASPFHPNIMPEATTNGRDYGPDGG